MAVTVLATSILLSASAFAMQGPTGRGGKLVGSCSVPGKSCTHYAAIIEETGSLGDEVNIAFAGADLAQEICTKEGGQWAKPLGTSCKTRGANAVCLKKDLSQLSSGRSSRPFDRIDYYFSLDGSEKEFCERILEGEFQKLSESEN